MDDTADGSTEMASKHSTPAGSHDLVPAPRRVEPRPGGGDFVLTAETPLAAEAGTEGVARWLRTTLGTATGFPLPPAAYEPPAPGAVRLTTDPEVRTELGPEGYRLTADAGGLHIAGGSATGVFWGAQTLRQLLGPDTYRQAPLDPGHDRRVPAQLIEDAPRFRWRGYLLDVARHFQPKDAVLRCLDQLAAHKLNVLHLHLTDDQGWRVEIRRYPRLTEIGAWRHRSRLGHRASPLWDERPHGGYYTQDDIREIVAYAAERHVTIVPEVDIPGHSQAAIAAYPELGNTDVIDTAALRVWDDWGVNPNVLAPTDRTLDFYAGVFEELLDLFPGRFVHIGGDECPKGQWRASGVAQRRMRDEGLRDEEELQAWFVRHFDRLLASHGRRLIGWDEILQGGSAPSDSLTGGSPDAPSAPTGSRTYEHPRAATATGLGQGAAVSSWRGYAGGVEAALAGHDVVMCPEQRVYLDHRQDPGVDEPVPIGFVRTLRDVYEFEPVPPQLAGTPHAERVLGTQANMWSEVTETRQRLEYQTYPRLAALAEVAWTPLPPPAQRDFADFHERLTRTHLARLDAMGVDYRPDDGPRPWQRRPDILGRPIEGVPPIV